MKTGMTLTQMAAELERQQNSKRDYIAPTNMIQATDSVGLNLGTRGAQNLTIRNFAHGQLASFTGIRKDYYDRMRTEAPALWATNVNHWLNADYAANGTKRLVRTIDGETRGFLSNSYRCIDNIDIAEATLPVLMRDDQLRIESADITESRMYIKAVSAKFEYKTVGDVVQAGVVIRNSEVGDGMIAIEPLIWKLSCLNGAIFADATLRKYHVGRKQEGLENLVTEFMRDDTRKADDRVLMMKVQDAVAAAFNDAFFRKLVDRFNATAERKIGGDPVHVVEVAAKRFGLNEFERGSVLKNLINGGSLTQFGLLNAVTATSQEVTLAYERATQLERLGGEIVDLGPTEWKAIAEAA
jgi:hypothetical protein